MTRMVRKGKTEYHRTGLFVAALTRQNESPPGDRVGFGGSFPFIRGHPFLGLLFFTRAHMFRGKYDGLSTCFGLQAPLVTSGHGSKSKSYPQ